MAEANAAAEPRDVRVPVIARRGPRSFSWWDLVLLPVHCAAILSTTKSFRNNPVIGSPVLNRRGLHVIRRRLAARLGAQRRRSLAGLLPAEDREAFERDGFIVKPNFLDEATFQAFRDEIMGLNADAREALIGDTLTRLIPLDGHTLRRLPTVQSVLEGSDYRGLLAYVGSFWRRPHLYVQTVFSQFARDVEPDVQSFFHSDTFHPTLKSWFFLQDVEEDGAPFTYVPGSHRPNQRRLAWERKISIIAHSAGDRLTAEGSLRISEAEILRLGYGAPRKVPVAANTLVVADTSGIHRRSRTERQTTRVSIWAYSRSNPFLPWAGGDIAAPLVIRGHAMLIYWAMADRLRDARRVQRDWHWVGRRSPLTPPRS
jgi:Phytanoyl-CoA dioxygenase (PhyH)